jgi:hypothetical protein
VIGRAFELAHSGVCRTIYEIRRQLKIEGYNYDLIEGRTLVSSSAHSCQMSEELCLLASGTRAPRCNRHGSSRSLRCGSHLTTQSNLVLSIFNGTEE